MAGMGSRGRGRDTCKLGGSGLGVALKDRMDRSSATEGGKESHFH